MYTTFSLLSKYKQFLSIFFYVFPLLMLTQLSVQLIISANKVEKKNYRNTGASNDIVSIQSDVLVTVHFTMFT